METKLTVKTWLLVLVCAALLYSPFGTAGVSGVVTEWSVRPSVGLDAVVFIGALSGNGLQGHYYEQQVTHVRTQINATAREALDRLAQRAEQTQTLVGPQLALLFSAGPTDSLADVIESARRPEERLRPVLEASPYWRPDRWPAQRDLTMPDALLVLLELQRIGFVKSWTEDLLPNIRASQANMQDRLIGYDIIPEQQKLLGRTLEPGIEVILLAFSKPYGIRITGQRFVAHYSYPAVNQLRIAAHEIFHPPFDIENESLLRSFDSLANDAWMKSIVEDHNPAFGYSTFEGMLNEDSSQALDQLVAEKFGFANDPKTRWKRHDDGIHMLAAAIYHMLREDRYDETGGHYESWLRDAVKRGLFEPSEVRRRAALVVDQEAVDRWPLNPNATTGGSHAVR